VRAHELDRGAGLELALAADDTYAEEARPLLHERSPRALVDMHPAGDRLSEAQPEFERGLSAVTGSKTRAASLARQDRPQHGVAAPGRDHGRDARGRSHLRRNHLRAHAAATELAPDADLGFTRELALGEQLGAGRPGSARVHALDLGEEDEQLRADEHRDGRR